MAAESRRDERRNVRTRRWSLHAGECGYRWLHGRRAGRTLLDDAIGFSCLCCTRRRWYGTPKNDSVCFLSQVFPFIHELYSLQRYVPESVHSSHKVSQGRKCLGVCRSLQWQEVQFDDCQYLPTFSSPVSPTTASHHITSQRLVMSFMSPLWALMSMIQYR